MSETGGSEMSETKLSGIIKKFPALSHFILSMVISGGIVLIWYFGKSGLRMMYIAGFGASIAAFILTAIEGGKKSIKELLGRIIIVKANIRWYLFAVLIIFVTTIITRVLGLIIYSEPFNILQPEVNVPEMGFVMSGGVIYLFAILLIIKGFFEAGIAEEFGYRGYVMPRLQAKRNALTSSIIVGLLWGLWHLILFWLPVTGFEVYYALGQKYGIIPACLLNSIIQIAMSIQMTYLFNNTRGSVFFASLFHATTAPAGLIFLFNGITNWNRGNFELLFVYMAVMVLISIILVIVGGPKNLSRKYKRNILGEPITKL